MSSFQQTGTPRRPAPPVTTTADGGRRLNVAPPVARDVRRHAMPALSLFVRVETLRQVSRVVSLLIVDFIGVFGALFTALWLKTAFRGDSNAGASWHQARGWISFAYLVTVLLFARADLYADRPRRPGMGRIAASLLIATLIAFVFAAANHEHFTSYYIFFSSFVLGTVYVSTLRELHTIVTGWALSAGGYERRALLIGSSRRVGAVADALSSRSHTHVDIVGYIAPAVAPPVAGIPSLGTLEELSEILASARVQEVILTEPDFPQDRAVELVDLCHRRGITVQLAPSTMELLVESAEFVPGQSVPLFRVKPMAFDGLDFTVKRTFDLLIATACLTLAAPVMLVIALAVKLSSRGPVLYRSVRPGIGGAPFDCLKFRTMRMHADKFQAELEALNEQSGALFKIRDDPRLTGVGRWLRRFSLDELPQLVNVLRGEMSLVGPRPLPVRDYERLAEWHKKRYLVLPGITGLWQVAGRSELDFDDLVRLDFFYVERWSILLDLSILLKTIPAVLSRRGAF